MKETLQTLLEITLKELENTQKIPKTKLPTIRVETPRDAKHGDYSTNIALILAGQSGIPPKKLAQIIADAIPDDSAIERKEIAGNGFINFFLKMDAQHPIIPAILKAGRMYGHTNVGENKKVLVEFVSTNPTGPLHVGHGRHAAYGAVVANLLKAAGYEVEREYYLNDAGRQIDIIAVSVWLRYLEIFDEVLPYPTACYQGNYIIDIAKDINKRFDNQFKVPIKKIADAIHIEKYVQNESQPDPDDYIDALAEYAKAHFGEKAYRTLQENSLAPIVQDIQEDLKEFGVVFEHWFSERSLYDNGMIEKAIEKLKEKNLTYKANDALWFRTTQYNDEKDRVLVRSNGQTTYFASDVAYHWHKINRGYDRLINILGADHHGYIKRITAAVDALGFDIKNFYIPLVQMVSLYRGGKEVRMSTRQFQYVTLRELREEIGNDAARFFYVMQKMDQHLKFDLDLAKAHSNENPVYYIQYAHARICSVFRQLEKQTLPYNPKDGLAHLSLLTTHYEKEIIDQLTRYEETLQTAALNFEPHRLTNYLKLLANLFHSYYNDVQFLIKDENLRNARLCLINSVKQVISNGLDLLGVSAPSVM